jgi:hypothetical protein
MEVETLHVALFKMQGIKNYATTEREGDYKPDMRRQELTKRSFPLNGSPYFNEREAEPVPPELTLLRQNPSKRKRPD